MQEKLGWYDDIMEIVIASLFVIESLFLLRSENNYTVIIYVFCLSATVFLAFLMREQPLCIITHLGCYRQRKRSSSSKKELWQAFYQGM
jgi:hypothetical protein